MPYSTANPPEAIRGLPPHAQAIFIAAFNAALKQYGGDEAKAFPVAWAAVKTKYRQVADGTWVAKEAEGEKQKTTRRFSLGDLEPIMVIPDYVNLAGSVARQGHGDDVDVLFRQNTKNPNLEAKVRKAVLKGDGEMHVHWKAEGPSGTHLALFDLMLVPKAGRRRRILDGSSYPYLDRTTEEKADGELNFEVMKADDEQQIVTSVVVLAGIPDTQRQAFPAAAITKAMYHFNSTYMGKKVFVHSQHGELVEAIPLESYQAPADIKFNGKVATKDSWLMTLKVVNKDEWEKVKKGEYTGLSPAIRFSEEAVRPMRAGKGAE